MLKDEGIRVPDGFATTAEAYRGIKWQKKKRYRSIQEESQTVPEHGTGPEPPWKNRPMRPKNRR